MQQLTRSHPAQPSDPTWQGRRWRRSGGRRILATLLVGTAILLATGAGGWVGGRPTAAPGAAAPGAPVVKSEIVGLVDRNGEPAAANLASVGGWVVNVKWSDLQPNSLGQALPSNNVIDNAITRVRALNASRPASDQLALKLRLFAGIHAPAWAKSLGGPPIAIYDKYSGAGGTVGRFWSSAFGSAWNSFDSEVAAKYDAVPEIRDVTISRCMTVYAEPLMRDISDPASVANLLHAGYTEAADKQCQQQQIDIRTHDWPHTNSSLSFNPYQVINANGSTTTDVTYSAQLMDSCRAALGSRCTLENNSIRSTDSTSDPLYSALRARGPNLQLQTATANGQKLGSLPTTLQFALDERAEIVELPSGYEKLMTPQQLAPFNVALRRNLASSGPLPPPTPGPTTTPVPAPSATPTPSPIPVGGGQLVTIFAYSGSHNPAATVASLPAEVNGVSWLFGWSEIEPAAPTGGRHTYNWKPIDDALSAAHAAGRTSMIRVIAGRQSPGWIAPAVTFWYQPLGPMPKAQVNMPTPWSSGFVSNWIAFIKAYGARYNGDSRLYAVQMPGAGVLGEMALPTSAAPSPANVWTNGLAIPNGTGNDVYTDAKMTTTWNTIVDAYRAAFPGTPTALDIGEPLGSTTVMPAVLAHAQSYGRSVFLQQNGLQGSTPPTSRVAQILSAASATTTVGWQEWGGNNTEASLQSSFTTALRTHASYVEVYLNDCINSADEPALDYLAAG